jgi:hypothetical protein
MGWTTGVQFQRRKQLIPLIATVSTPVLGQLKIYYLRKYKSYYVGFEVHRAVVVKSSVFWDITP